VEAPELTCIIPTFNDRTNLKRAVDSALSQQGVRTEVILVDDCSDTSTQDFIRQLARSDERISCFFLPENGGQGRARNIGAVLARARLVAFLDQDDEHETGWYLHALGKFNDAPALGALGGGTRIIDIPARLGIDETDIRIGGLSAVFVTNIVFRRSVFLASGGFPTADVWRSRIAGEDGAFRHAMARNWRGAQSDHPALIHRAKEGGATVFFLDRSKVEDGRVVMTRLEDIEINGVMENAQEDFWRAAMLSAEEVRQCVALP
jgi:glycosyltransferase involved in cell wall biosynthesis